MIEDNYGVVNPMACKKYKKEPESVTTDTSSNELLPF
jgi:hypothetical protein